VDDNAARAASLDLVLIKYPHNSGYGANQKTRYIAGLRDRADVIVMLHPNGQFRSSDPRGHGGVDQQREGPSSAGITVSHARW
jgi:hypothetical protein